MTVDLHDYPVYQLTHTRVGLIELLAIRAWLTRYVRTNPFR